MGWVAVTLALLLLTVSVYAWRQRRRLVQLQVRLADIERRAEKELKTDHLTGLPNRAALERWLQQSPPSSGLLVVCDLDNFKELNDRYGHLVGDEILRDVAQLIRSSIRAEDWAFRWGGDEFVVCFQTDNRLLVEGRMRALERRLADFRVRNRGPVPLRLSWGVARFSPALSPQQCLQEADERMLEAKRQRRLT